MLLLRVLLLLLFRRRRRNRWLFIPLFFRLFGVGEGDFLDDFFPAPVLLRIDERAARVDVPAAAIVRCCCGGGGEK